MLDNGKCEVREYSDFGIALDWARDIVKKGILQSEDEDTVVFYGRHRISRVVLERIDFT